MDIEIGKKLREIRTGKGMSIEQLANETGFTKSFISQVENDKAAPSIASLLKIGKVLGVTLSHFFEEKPKLENIVLRENERNIFTSPASKFSAEVLAVDISNRKMAPLLGRLWEGAETGYYSHQGEECAYLIQGKIELVYGEETIRLKKGDSFYIDGSIPHKLVNVGEGEAIGIWVSCPPFS